MTSERRFRITDRGQRAVSRGSVAVAVIFVVVANLMVFGVLAAILLPRSDGGAKEDAAGAPAVAMTLAAPVTDGAAPASETAKAGRKAAARRAGALPDPPAALARPSVAPGGPSLVLARSAQRVHRACAPRATRRMSIAQHPITPPEPGRVAEP